MTRDGRGWHKEPGRHSLAAKGIKTGRKGKQGPGPKPRKFMFLESGWYEPIEGTKTDKKPVPLYPRGLVWVERGSIGILKGDELIVDEKRLDVRLLHRRDIRDIVPISEGIKAGRKQFRDLPKDPTKMTPRQREDVISFLAAKPLKELRRRQDIVDSQIALAHRQRNTVALNNLREMYQHLVEAIDRKVFGGGN